MEELLAGFINWLGVERGLSPLTVKNYSLTCQKFLLFLQQEKKTPLSGALVASLPLQDLRAFLSHRAQGGMEKSSQAVTISVIKSLYAFLMHEGHTITTPLTFLRRPKVSRRVPRPLSLATLETFEENGPHHGNLPWVKARNVALLFLLYGGGLRIQEALNIKMASWPTDLTMPLKILGKGKKERYIPLLPSIHKAVAMYRHLCPHDVASPEKPLFVGVRGKQLSPAVFQYTVRAWRNAGHGDHRCTPHSFRHSFASHLLENGANLRDIQELLGHSSLASTQWYTTVPLQQLRRIFEENAKALAS